MRRRGISRRRVLMGRVRGYGVLAHRDRAEDTCEHRAGGGETVLHWGGTVRHLRRETHIVFHEGSAGEPARWRARTLPYGRACSPWPCLESMESRHIPGERWLDGRVVTRRFPQKSPSADVQEQADGTLWQSLPALSSYGLSVPSSPRPGSARPAPAIESHIWTPWQCLEFASRHLRFS